MLDNQGNLYVAGEVTWDSRETGRPLSDYFLVKLATQDGQILWSQRYSEGVYKFLTGVAVDNSGNTILTGHAQSQGGSGEQTEYDYLTVKYDARGRLLWVQRYNGGSEDRAQGIAIDAQGNIYVTGYSKNSANGDCLTLKYDPNGRLLWTQRYDRGSEDGCYGIAVDRQGDIYVTGSSGTNTIRSTITLKYSNAGGLLWERRYSHLANSYHEAAKIVLDWRGNLYVIGITASSLGSPSSDVDYLTISYDATGNLRWATNYNGLGNGVDIPFSIAVDWQGNVHVTGFSWMGDGLNFDFATVKYSQCPSLCTGDVNVDRVVDDIDILSVLFAFGSRGILSEDSELRWCG